MRGVLLPLAVVFALVVMVPAAAAVDTDPGVSPSFALFPTADDVQADLAKHADHPWVELRSLGDSSEGRPIQYAIITDPDSAVPMEERVVTFIFTQQHGNEPAGTPAALQLLADITTGNPIAATLDNQILLLLPMANPDGATANQRGNAGGVDINRDHIDLETPEANILHTVVNEWDVHVAMDHHEYGGTGLGNPSPVRAYDYDLTTMFPVHGNVRAPTFDAANKLMYEGIWPAAEAAGFTANEYGEETVAGVPIESLPDEVEGPIEDVAGPIGQIAGGPDPGIMRNHLGLHNVAGLLVETRIDAHPNPFHDAARRTAVHSNVMESTLTYVHDNAKMFLDAKRESARLNVEAPMTTYIEGDATALLDPAYRTSTAVGPLFARHGLHEGHAVDGALVHNMTVPLQGHAAAIVHPESSRVVEAGVATDAVLPASVAGSPVEEAAPGVGVLVLLAVGLLALVRRR